MPLSRPRALARATLEWLRDLRALPSRERRVFLATQLRRLVGLRRDRLPSLGTGDTVLFVCHGNIMRSAAAAALLEARLASAGVAGMTVTSAGTDARDGREAEPRAVAEAARLGVSLATHRARALDAGLVAAARVVVVMDRRNEARVLARHPEAAGRTVLLGAFGPPDPVHGIALPDPYMGDAEDVRACFARVARGVDALAAHALRDGTASRG